MEGLGSKLVEAQGAGGTGEKLRASTEAKES